MRLGCNHEIPGSIQAVGTGYSKNQTASLIDGLVQPLTWFCVHCRKNYGIEIYRLSLGHTWERLIDTRVKLGRRILVKPDSTPSLRHAFTRTICVVI